MLGEETDGQLVRRIASGNGARDAEAELCRRFLGRARLYGLRHLRNDDRAKDLAQVAMLGVLEAIRAGRVEDPDRIDRFILGTCRNAAQRMREREERAALTPDGELDLLAAVPDREMIDTGILVRCIAELDPRSRTVVHMSFFQQCPAEEIATSLATTAGNVRVLRHRAVADLRRCVDGRQEQR
jgi:RNA polymerase sigma-70 factor (ECF subfamily)